MEDEPRPANGGTREGSERPWWYGISQSINRDDMGRQGYAIVGLIFVVLLIVINRDTIAPANWIFALTTLSIVGIALLAILLYPRHRQARHRTSYHQARHRTARQGATIPPTTTSSPPSAAPSRTRMSVEENKALARRELEELFSHTGNLDAAEEIYAPGFVAHSSSGSEDIRGVQAAKHFAASYRRAFHDLLTTVEELLAEGEKVVARWTVRGTHQGEIEELGPPTGKHIEATGISVYRIEGGKIAEYWAIYDALGMMRQLGVIPADPSKGTSAS